MNRPTATRRLALILSLGLLACAPEPPAQNADDPATAARAALWTLFDEEWAWRLAQYPRTATYAGIREHDDRLASVTPEAYAKRADYWRGVLARLATIDLSALSVDDQVNAAMFERQLSGMIADIELRDFEMPLNSDEGFHISFAFLPDDHPFLTVEDYDNYIARLQAWPRVVKENIDNMRAGLARGFTPPQVVLEGYAGSISDHIVSDMTKSVFYPPFTRFPATFSAAAKERLAAAGGAAIRAAVVPGFATFHDFFTREYFPAARQTVGASELPDGEAYYAHKVRHFTTLDMTPAEIHELGRSEVARIRAEMEAIVEEVEFEGSFADFLTFLRTDPQFYAETGEELLMIAAYISKTMDGKLPALFATLPRLPYTVNPVPEHLAPKYTGGRYIPAPAGSTQPGQYWVNTYDLASRPLYVLPALTLHEAVPGHHFQFALALEQSAQPDFRRYDYISAYGEGWGLYSEFLGLEAGMYTTPYERFGRLTYEMWRACRLVVDTGVHAMGWSRDEVRDYLAANTALSLHEITTETDRYISWPAQALSYKLGELKIRELRARAEAAHGADFDLRAFHDAVLENGSVPLTVLEERIEAWIAGRTSR